MRKIPYIILGILLSILFLPDLASAGPCGRVGPCRAYKYASAVFIGRVVGGTQKVSEEVENGKTVSYEAGEVRFAVEESFKGVEAAEITVFVPGPNPVGGGTHGLRGGELYVVYAGRSGSNKLEIYRCSTHPLEGSSEEVNILRILSAGGVGGRIYGYIHIRASMLEIIPMAGVTVVVKREGTVLEAVTNDKGRYEIAGVKPGEYIVEPILPEYYIPEDKEHERQKAVVANGECEEILFQVMVNGGLNGRVIDVAGRAAPADLQLIDVANKIRRFHALAKGDGEFQFTGVSPGRYRLSVVIFSDTQENDDSEIEEFYYPGTPVLEESAIIEIGFGQQVSGFTFTLPSKVTVHIIRGRVTYSDGRPTGNAKVEVETMKNPGLFRSIRFLSSATTDEQGNFSLHAFKGHRYKISAEEDQETADNERREQLCSKSIKVTLNKDETEINLIIPLAKKKQAPPLSNILKLISGMPAAEF